MSQEDSQAVTVKLLDKEFSFNCPPDAKSELLASAEFLNTKMFEIRKSGRVLGLERIAVMAALNLAHELLHNNTQPNEDVEERLQLRSKKIDQAMNKKKKKSLKNSLLKNFHKTKNY